MLIDFWGIWLIMKKFKNMKYDRDDKYPDKQKTPPENISKSK